MEEISRELLFAHTLEKVRQIAKEQGNYIREEQVRGEFSGLNLSDSQLQMVIEYLAKYGIVDENAGMETDVFTEDESQKKQEVLGENRGLKGEEIDREGEIPKGEEIDRGDERPKRKQIDEESGGHEGKKAEERTNLLEEALTEEERDYLQTYLDEIAALPIYEKEQLDADVTAAIAGDAKAQERLMESMLKDVADIAKLYVGQGVFLEDLIGEGNMALTMGLQTIGNMEQKSILKGFSEVQSLLAKQVMDAMESFVRENADNEKVDKKVAERVNLVADKARELSEELRRKVTPEELAQEAGLSIKAIQDAMRMSGYKIEEIMT